MRVTNKFWGGLEGIDTVVSASKPKIDLTKLVTLRIESHRFEGAKVERI